MPEWDATTFDAKDNLLRVVRHEADRFFALAQAPGAWEAPTACPRWQVRDLVGHIIDVTESYFVGFDAARSGAEHPDAFGTRAMQTMLDEGAKAHRVLSQADAVERLRSDFAKLMETFEKHQVAFVSVTQQFNTATSMGRLVLNVLLSFAQFEREIIAERTRDKIAAARRKRKWSGGMPLLGYDVDPRLKKLVVKGAQLDFTVDVQVNGMLIHLAFSGTVEGDKLKGAVTANGQNLATTGERAPKV